MSRAGDDPAWSLLDVGGRRVSEATASVRDSSRADLIGPRVVLPRRTPQPCQHRCYVTGVKNQRRRARTRSWSTLCFENGLQRIQRPGDPIAHQRVLLLKLADARFLTLQSGAQSIPFTFKHRQTLLERALWRNRLRLAAPAPVPRKRDNWAGLPSVTPGHGMPRRVWRCTRQVPRCPLPSRARPTIDRESCSTLLR